MTNSSFGQQANVPYPSPVAPIYPQEPNLTSYPYAAAPLPAPIPVPSDPGRTLGVVGLVASIFFSAVGLILSIVAFRKSRRAGFKNGIALAGIVIGIITTLGILTAGVAGGIGAMHVVSVCRDLGPGEHHVNGVTYTCG
jgi:hypothetical protein